jgi:Right handed beta helix region
MRRITFLACLALSVVALAGERHVPAHYSSIQAAIDAAVHGDVVVVGRGTYREAIDVSGKDITVRSSDGPAVTILDGSGMTASILTVKHVEWRKAIVEGFTFRNGSGSVGEVCGTRARKGGAILVAGADLTVIDCVFEDNGALAADGTEELGFGGAIFACETNLKVRRSRFERNRAGHGGAIDITSFGPRESSIERSRFTRNRAGESGAVSAYLDSFATLAVRDCDFDDNEAGHAGGMAMTASGRSRVTVERVRFAANRANGAGGALYVAARGGGSAAIVDSDFEANRAAHGAGLRLHAASTSTVSVAGCTFTGGAASFGAGAIIESRGSAVVELADCDFRHNQASFGGGLFASAQRDGNETGARLRIRGSRFLDNVAVPDPETGIYHSLCFIDGRPPEGSGLYFGGGADLRAESGGAITVSSSLFAGNSGMRAGGVHASTCAGGSIDLVNNTVVDNDGSGVHVRFGLSRQPEYTGLGTIRMANMIVRGNAADEIVADRFDSRSDVAVTYSNVEGGYAGARNFDLPPSFVDPAARDYRLAPGSTCIDAGNNSALAEVTEHVDLARRPRLVDDPRTADTGSGPAPVVDVGAYEYQWSAPRRRAVRP